MANTSTPHRIEKINLNGTIDDIFLVLTDKEKEIIVRRFSLDDKPRDTLEKIGQKFSVTRERIRQIEENALRKLRRTIGNTQLESITDLAKHILKESDGLMIEDTLISKLLNYTSGGEIDWHIIRLSLSIDEDVIPVKLKKSNELKNAWRLDTVSDKNIKAVIETVTKVLKKEKDILDERTLLDRTKKVLKVSATNKFILSSINVSRLIKLTEKGWGLMEWRHVNPKSIRDKAYIIMKKIAKPLHFVEISNRIAEAGFDKKIVTVQAVHNELIRDEKFVLIGRGLYALREWGYSDGTVASVIEEILLKSKKPLSKSKIVEEVLKLRQVKQGTIALNLQKNPKFVRVGRAVYQLKK